jgi:hypothetical protein
MQLNAEQPKLGELIWTAGGKMGRPAVWGVYPIFNRGGHSTIGRRDMVIVRGSFEATGRSTF